MHEANPRKVLLVAGESSGDRLAARVITAATIIAHERNTPIEFFGIGGDLCLAQGMNCLVNAREMSVVGFLEVARRYGFFRSVFKRMVSLLDDPKTRPDVILLVDYPGFNIRLAAEAKRRGIEVIYYVSPQVWAWKASRVKKIVASVSRMLVIFPFEVEIYTKAGLAQTEFVGHPLLEIIDEEREHFVGHTEFALAHDLDPNRDWLLLFPGSRTEEVRRHLGLMIEAARLVGPELNMQPVIVRSENVADSLYLQDATGIVPFRSAGDIHQLLYHSQLGILKSGTTTLEAALAGLPGVICYRTSWLTYAMARMLVKLNYIGLANIVLGKMLYPELLQDKMTARDIADTLVKIHSHREQFTAELSGVRAHLEQEGAPPSARVAAHLFD